MSPVEDTNRASKPSKLDGASHAWRALRHRNFRLFFGGQSISLIGTWMTRIATAWLVYRLTGSALLLGTVSFAGQIPTFLFAPFAGVWVDRLNRRQVLVWTQALSMVQSLALAALTLSGHITIPWILVLSVTQGIINAFDMPGRQAFMVQMVERPRRPGQRHRHQLLHGQRGPPHRPFAGRHVDRRHQRGLVLPHRRHQLHRRHRLAAGHAHDAPAVRREATSTVTELKEGWTYVSGFLPIRTILLLFAVVSLMGMPFVVLMPIFAARVLHGGPHTLGFLMGAMGVGALVSALSLAARKSVRGLMRMIPIAAAVFGIGTGRLRPVAGFLAVNADGAGRRHGHDAGHGRQQHHHPDAGRRRQARPRDELLHHGLHGHGALRQPAGRNHGQRHRRANGR